MKRTTTPSTLFYIFFTFLFLFFTSNLLYGQEPACGTEFPADYTPERLKNTKDYQNFLREFQAKKQYRSLSGSCINSAPIRAHIIRQSNGTGGLTVQQLNDAIDTMNTFYANSCIEFYLCGAINYIDNDNYYNFNKVDEPALRDANEVDSIINIFFTNSITNDDGLSLCGYAYYPSINKNDIIMMRNSCTINGSTLSHEVGHFFSLPHTHNTAKDELVDGSNCATTGDKFCDTPADPRLGTSIVNSSCTYTGTETDTNGDTYMPNPNLIMSYSRKSCRDEFSDEQYAAMAYTFLNVRNYWTCPDFDVDFEVDVATSCASPLASSFTEMAVGESTYKWDFDNDGIIDDSIANPSFNFGTDGIYDVALTVSDGTRNIRKFKPAFVNIGSKAYPYAQNIETFTPSYSATGFEDGWETFPNNTQAEYRWNVNSGTTVSGGSGPTGDHTAADGSGIYIYTEASGSDPGDVAELISPCLDVPLGLADASIRFWYHMYGSTMGELHIDLFDGNNWINDIAPAIVGAQQSANADSYLEKEFSIAAYEGMPIKIRFRGIRGSNFNSDIAIDDFELFDASAPAPVELVYFIGKEENEQHLLSWETASEQNSAFFSLEHSLDGERFSAIAKIDAQGQSFESQFYDHTNTRPHPGINYYRLKMVDWDGSFTYSNIIQLEMKRGGDGLSIFPNPGKGLYQLELQTSIQEVDYLVYNAVGQIIKQGQWNPRESYLSIDISNFSNGIYLIQIRDGGQLIDLQRIVKQ